MTATVNTQAEEHDEPGVDPKYLFALVIFIASPLTVLSAAVIYLLFSYQHIRRSVLLLFSSPLILGTLVFAPLTFGSFIRSWTETLPAMIQGEMGVAAGIFTMLGQQFFVGTTAGVFLGLGLASILWFSRARWRTIDFRRTPWELLKYRRTVNDIRLDRNRPQNGSVTLGVVEKNYKLEEQKRSRDFAKKPIYDFGDRAMQPFVEASAHVVVIGGSGTGKTRTCLGRLHDQIMNGEPAAIVDLKADPEVAFYAKILADRAGQPFYHFTIQDILQPYVGPATQGNSNYDPISRGDHTRRTDLVLELREWDSASDVYKKLSQSYLQLMFQVLINNPNPNVSTLEDAITLMNPLHLQERARPLSRDPRFSSLVTSIDSLNDERMSNTVRDNLKNIKSQLEIFLQGVAGPWLINDPNGNNISLSKIAREGGVVVFSLDSQQYGELAANIANLVIQDLKTVSSELLANPIDRPFHVFIDEFSAIGGENIIQLINKARASNMSVTVATQTIGDLIAKSPGFKEQMLGIVGSFIIHRANHAEEASVYSGLAGTTEVTKERAMAQGTRGIFGEIGRGAGSGSVSVTSEEEDLIKPKQFQDLGIGEYYYISSIGRRAEHLRTILQDIADPTKGGARHEVAPTPSPIADSTRSAQQQQANSATTVADPNAPVMLPTLADFGAQYGNSASQKPVTMTQEHFPEDPYDIGSNQPPAMPQTQRGNKTNGVDLGLLPLDSPERAALLARNAEAITNDLSGAQQAAILEQEAFEAMRISESMKKVEPNYALLARIFSNKDELRQQEQRDIQEGVVPVNQRSSAPLMRSPQAPAAPQAAPQQPAPPMMPPQAPVAAPQAPVTPQQPAPLPWGAPPPTQAPQAPPARPQAVPNPFLPQAPVPQKPATAPKPPKPQRGSAYDF